MINAKIHAELNDNAGLIIEFSDPKGMYKDDPKFFTAVRDRTDLLKRLYFKNRHYICDTIHSYLNQRKRATRGSEAKIEVLQVAINRGKNYTYEALCHLIYGYSSSLKQLSPPDTSPFYNHFKTVIEPILIECENVHTGKAKVHYC